MKLQRFLEDELSLGKGSIKMPIRDYIEKQKKAYTEYSRSIKSTVYRITGKDGVFFHVKIPSASLDDFYYDVLIELGSDGFDFEDSHIKIFSNSPSFVYSFAYVFYHLDDDELESKGLIVDGYDKKIPKNRLLLADKKISEEVLHGYPDIRNPYGIPLFDKTVFMAIFHILDKYKKKGLMPRLTTETQLLKSIYDFDTLMLLRHKFELKKQEEDLRKRLDDAPKKVRDNAIGHLKDGDNVHVTKSNVVVIRPTKNATRAQAASSSVNKIKSGQSGGVNKVRPRKS